MGLPFVQLARMRQRLRDEVRPATEVLVQEVLDRHLVAASQLQNPGARLWFNEPAVVAQLFVDVAFPRAEYIT